MVGCGETQIDWGWVGRKEGVPPQNLPALSLFVDLRGMHPSCAQLCRPAPRPYDTSRSSTPSAKHAVRNLSGRCLDIMLTYTLLPCRQGVIESTRLTRKYPTHVGSAQSQSVDRRQTGHQATIHITLGFPYSHFPRPIFRIAPHTNERKSEKQF